MAITCLSTCQHVEISDALYEGAENVERLIQEQKEWNNPSTLPLNKRRDLIGAIGQFGIMDVFEYYGMSGGLNLSPYFDPNNHSDNYDFEYRGVTYDIKSSPVRTSLNTGVRFSHVTNRTTFLVSDRQRNKRGDNYLFCMVDLDERVIHYAGYINYDRFWELSNPATQIKSPAHIIRTDQLTPIMEMMV